MKFLGSGAFGEVFEGKARGIPNSSGDTKVAVKVKNTKFLLQKSNFLFTRL